MGGLTTTLDSVSSPIALGTCAATAIMLVSCVQVGMEIAVTGYSATRGDTIHALEWKKLPLSTSRCPLGTLQLHLPIYIRLVLVFCVQRVGWRLSIVVVLVLSLGPRRPPCPHAPLPPYLDVEYNNKRA